MIKKCIFVSVLRIFYGNRPIALYIAPLIVGFYVMVNYFTEYHVPEENIHFGFWGTLLNQNSKLSSILAPILVLLNALLLNNTFNKHDFLGKNRFLTSLLYIVFLSFFHTFYFLDGFSIGLTFIILSLHQMFRLNQNEDGRKTVFNVAFLLGIATTFYPLLLVSVPFLFWMIWVIRPFIMRESILTLVGFVIPLIYAGVYEMYFEFSMNSEGFSSNAKELNLEDSLLLAGGVLLLALFSLKTFLLRIKQGSIRLRKLFSVIIMLLIFIFIISSLSYLLFNKKDVFAIIFVPLSFILPYAFGFKTLRLIPSITFYLIFLLSVGKFFVTMIL